MISNLDTTSNSFTFSYLGVDPLVNSLTLPIEGSAVGRVNNALFHKMRARVSFVIGEVSSERLGMNDHDWEIVSKSTHYILHAAALTDWGAAYEYAFKINVNRVKQVLSLARSCSRLKKMIHISTAYVTGSRTGNLTPDDFCREEQSCDNYQITKTEGERLVRNEWNNLTHYYSEALRSSW